MVKKIKTVEQLEKHIGETLHVVSREGYAFDATVERTGDSSDSWLVLKTKNKVANKDHSWWPLDGKICHNCAYDHQITEELQSLTTIEGKKASGKKKTQEYLTKDELDAARGHFCLLKDGSKGFICTKTATESRLTRVLHNYSNARGWIYTDTERSEDNAPETIKHDFTKAWNVWSESDAESLKVVEVLEKYDGRKYRFKKAKKTVEEKEDTKFLTISEIYKGIGHLCKLADGQEALIAVSDGGAAIICMRSRSQGQGWSLDASDVADKFKDNIKDYKYGWGIHCTRDADTIKVVSILDEPKSESPKTILDMTIKEVLEKLDEIIKR